MLNSITLIGAVVTLQTVSAFSNTYPLIAWASQKLDSLVLLSPSHFSNSPTIFRPSTPQTPFPESTPDDLCTLTNLLLISIPGLHSSDLSLLPTTVSTSSSSSTGIRSALINAEKTKGMSLNLPYIPFQSKSISGGKSQAGFTAEKLAKKFVSECGAVIEKEGQSNLWAGESGKTLKIQIVEGLEDWDLIGTAAKNERSKIMKRVDLIVKGHLASLQGPYLVILTSIPTTAISALSTLKHVAHNGNAKRQYSSYSDAEDSEFGEFEFDPTLPAVVPESASAKPRATSIFAVDPKSGLLHRYVFFTQPLIFALIISLVILIPVVVLGSQALTSIETLSGLEGKMTGSVALDTTKSG